MCSYSLFAPKYIDDIYDIALNIERYLLRIKYIVEGGGFCLYIKIFNYINEFVLSFKHVHVGCNDLKSFSYREAANE